MNNGVKKRIWFVTSVLILLLVCSYFLFYFYEVERNRKIEDIVTHQKVHARLAATNFKQLFDNFGSELLYLSTDKNIIDLNDKGKYDLEKLLAILKNEIRSITRVDEKGIILFTTPFHAGSVGSDISKQNHIAEILKNHKPVVSDVFTAVQGFQAVAIHYPIFKNGKFKGTIALVLNFRDIAKKNLDQIKIEKSTYVWMLSRAGIELYSPNQNNLGKSINLIAKISPDLYSIGDKMRRGDEGVATFHYNQYDQSKKDVDMIAYYHPVQIYNTYWSIAVISSAVEITSSLTDFRNKLILLVAIIFIGGVFISYFGIKAWVILKGSIENKIAQEKLEDSEELLRTFIQQSTDGYMIIDENGLIREWNRGMEEIVGLQKTDAENRYWLDIMVDVMIPENSTPPNIKLYKTILEQILLTGKVLDQNIPSDISLQRKDGSIISIQQSLFPIISKNGIRIGCIVKNVTQRKKFEIELETERLLLRTLIENLPSAVFVKDKNYRKVIVNKQHSESVRSQLIMIGYQPDINIIGKTDFEVYPKEMAELYYNDDRKVIEDGHSILNQEETGYDPKGEKVWLLVSKIPLYNQEGELNGMVGITTDVTSLKKSEEALHESQENFSRIMNTVDEIIYSIDGESGEFEYLSPAFEKKLGYSLQDIKNIGGRWAFLSKVITDKDAPKNDPVTNELRKSIFTETPVWEHWWRCKNGNLLYMEDLSVPIYEGKKLRRIDGVLRDITDRKKAELEIIRAKEHAEEMNRLKSNFLANMSHELRTPLVGMLGFSELLYEEIEGQKKEYAKLINISSHRLLRTLNTLLNYSKIDSENIVANPSEFSLANLLHNEVNLFTAFANQNGLFLKEEFDASDIMMNTDVKMLKEIIDNLLNNALRFTKVGGVTISYETKDADTLIKITDSGIGIPEDKLQLIFEEFRQVSEGVGRNFEGTGLGLTIVKKYVEALGGSIAVSSTLNEGSTFSITIPINFLINEENRNNSARFANIISVKERNAFNEFKKLLLVEDDSINSLAIQSMLEDKYNIIAVSSADYAKTNAVKIKFDLVLMDINLKSGNDGILAAKEILKIEGYDKIPMLAMTAYVTPQDQNEFKDAGFTHYLPKPFTQDQILELIDSIFEKKS